MPVHRSRRTKPGDRPRRRWSEGRRPRRTRTDAARAGHGAGEACHRRRSAYGRSRGQPSNIRGGSRMQESYTYGSVRRAPSNACPYRNREDRLQFQAPRSGPRMYLSLRSLWRDVFHGWREAAYQMKVVAVALAAVARSVDQSTYNGDAEPTNRALFGRSTNRARSERADRRAARRRRN